ncbi:MAG: hypothetical protein PHN59_03295 [Candidatus Omnitrophica bacterium]|nr:hypothetical protein [Candidatus Omnitrophota bacterium]
MDKGLLKNILIIFFLSVAAFSIVKYAAIFQEKRALTEDLNSIKQKLAVLEEEKEAFLAELEQGKEQVALLSQDKAVLKQNLKAVKKRMAKLFTELNQTKKAIEQLNSKFLLLKAENVTLIKRSKKVNQLSAQNQALRENLYSIPELRKRIAELKKDKNAPLEIEVNANWPALEGQNPEGNRGFLLKNGQPTYPAKVKIEVITIPNDAPGESPEK